MKHKHLIITAGLAFASALILQAQEMPEPTAEHQWLQQFVGKWESDIEIYMDPDSPPMRAQVTETYRSLGGFWVVGDIVSRTPEMPFSGLYTIGYDPEKEVYVGTWIESMTSNLTTYEGTVDSDGTILVMETEAPCPMRQGRVMPFRETTEFINENHRVSTTEIFEDGEWIPNVKIESRRILD